MKDVVERSREVIETTINRMEESCDPEIKAGIKGDKITGAMLPYVTTIEDTTSTITPQQICDYIDLLYENDREYNLYWLQVSVINKIIRLNISSRAMKSPVFYCTNKFPTVQALKNVVYFK